MNSKQKQGKERLNLAIDYVFAFSPLKAAAIIARILIAKASKRELIDLPLPETDRTISLRSISSDIATYNQIFIHHEYDIRSTKHATMFLERMENRKGSVLVIDCGANVGCGAAWFALQFPDARIIAIEPDLENWNLLRHNVKQFPNAEALHAAVWSTETEVVISNPDARPWAYQTEEVNVDAGEKVGDVIKAITLNSLIDRCDPTATVIVKMDIEGAEREVFSQNTSWLDRVDLLIIEPHDNLFPWQGNSRNFMAAVASRPMDYQIVGENLFCFHDRR